MGERTQVLLVSRRAALSGALGSLVLSACGNRTAERAADRVVARDHDAFFLWAGVAPPSWLGKARTVYLLAGEVVQNDVVLVHLRAVPRVVGPALWATVRLERLDWSDSVRRAVLRLPERWEAAGNTVAGLQLDFDSATRGLDGYVTFLEEVRHRLPRRFRLSVTGLLDWSAGGDPRALARLAGVVDEIVVQTYQGRRTIPGYERYLAALSRLGLPYRIGLVEGGEWRAPPGLGRDPLYRGTVVFLLSRGSRPGSGR